MLERDWNEIILLEESLTADGFTLGQKPLENKTQMTSVAPYSFHSGLKLFWDEHKEISVFQNDDQVTHGSARVNKKCNVRINFKIFI